MKEFVYVTAFIIVIITASSFFASVKADCEIKGGFLVRPTFSFGYKCVRELK